MGTGYFPNTALEYNVYFNIDRLKRAYVHNLNRIGILSKMPNSRQNTKLINKCKELSLILKKLIRQENIETINDFSASYNTVILLNRAIDKDISDKVLTKAYRKSVGKKKFKKVTEELSYVGNIVFESEYQTV